MKDWKYQWSSKDNNGEIIVVRADTQEELLKEVEWAKSHFSSNLPPTGTTVPSSPIPTNPAALCKTCGAATLPEKRITAKDGRAWWVRDCSTGDRTHKGPIRPAE